MVSFKKYSVYIYVIMVIIVLTVFSYGLDILVFKITGYARPRYGLVSIVTNNTKESFASNFVPVEDVIVPTHASYSNKLNDSIGTRNAQLVVPGAGEVVVPSDWFMSRELPTEYDGPYWPSGSIQYDFLFPGSDPKRLLRNQGWNAAYTH
jgi:hypothetical protein